MKFLMILIKKYKNHKILKEKDRIIAKLFKLMIKEIFIRMFID